MSKPAGESHLGPGMRVIRPTLSEDQIWDAVETARMEGKTVEWFLDEAKDAWAESLEDEAKAVRKMR